MLKFASYAAIEKILSETASEAVKKANSAIDAMKSAAEAVRHHSEKLKKAMEDADVSCHKRFAKMFEKYLSSLSFTSNYECPMFIARRQMNVIVDTLLCARGLSCVPRETQ